MEGLLLFKPIIRILQNKNIIGTKIACGSIKDNRSTFYSISYYSAQSNGIAVFNVIVIDDVHYMSANELRIQSHIFGFKMVDILKLYKIELEKQSKGLTQSI